MTNITFPTELPKDNYCDMIAVNNVPSWRNPSAYLRAWREKDAIEMTPQEREEIINHLEAKKAVAVHNLEFRQSFNEHPNANTRAWFTEGIGREKAAIATIERQMAEAGTAKKVSFEDGRATFE